MFSPASNSFEIILDTTNITSDYTNTLVVEYSYDSTVFTLETDVFIQPTLPQSEPVITYIDNSILLENSYEFKAYEPNQFGAPPILIDKLNFSAFGDDILHLKLKNIGDADATIDSIEIENAHIYLDELNKIEIPNDETLDGIEALTTYIAKHRSNANKLNNIYNNGILTSEQIDALVDKSSIKNYLNYKTVSISQPEYNAFNTGIFNIVINVNKFKPTKNYINGIPTIIKVTYGKKGSTTKHTVYLGHYLNFNLTFIIGEMSLLYDKQTEAIKYVRPTINQTFFVDIYKKVTFNRM